MALAHRALCLAARFARAPVAAGRGAVLVLAALVLAASTQAAGTREAPGAPAHATDSVVPPAAVPVRVLTVHDGDSLLVRDAHGRTYGVRLAGIDAPERMQAHAEASRSALQALMHGREVRLEALKIDFYGRTVGRMFVGGRDAGLAQLRAGLAWHFARYDADLPPRVARRYARAERQARLRRIGLWRDAAPVPPWEHRARMRAAAPRQDRR